MANTKKTTTVATETKVAETISISKEEFDAMKEKTSKLEALLEQLLEAKDNEKAEEKTAVTQSYVSTNRMDIPCTLIHMLDCNPNLPTTISINGITHYFTSFGEKKMFLWKDMSNIVSKYRTWFNRGVFALGEDCEQFRNELPSDILSIPLPEQFFTRLNTFDEGEFEKYISKITPSQKAQVANVWIKRYREGQHGYNDLRKIKILNKQTGGLLKEIIQELTLQDE